MRSFLNKFAIFALLFFVFCQSATIICSDYSFKEKKSVMSDFLKYCKKQGISDDAQVLLIKKYLRAQTNYQSHQEIVQDLFPYAIKGDGNVVSAIELQELDFTKIYDLVSTYTPLGKNQLVRESQVVASKEAIKDKQVSYRYLQQNITIKNTIERWLRNIDNGLSRSILPYWNPAQSLNKACLQHYFQWSSLQKYNKSKRLLDISYLFSLGSSTKTLVSFFAMWNILPSVAKILSEEKPVELKMLLGVCNQSLIDQHNFLHTKSYDKDKTYSIVDLASFIPQWSPGYTHKDRCKILSNLTCPKITWSSDSNNVNTSLQQKDPSMLSQIITIFFAPADYCLNKVSNFRKHCGLPSTKKVGCGLIALLPTAYFDYCLGQAVRKSYEEIKRLYGDTNALHNQLVDVRRTLYCIMHLFKFVCVHQEFKPMANAILNMSVQDKKDLQEIIFALQSPTFKNNNKWFYSRGEVLCVQRLLRKKKLCLLPLLEFVATVDARVGIANLLIDSQKSDYKWSMVHFVDQPMAMMNYKDLWLPLHATDKPVANDVILGCYERANKSIIAGANGGGKTSYLKSIGVAALLAQSWGIVPAAYAEQVWFSSVRTCLNPPEDLSKGLSKFMVQKKRMDEYVMPHVQDVVANNEHILLLIDEPYSGTVEVEKNMRTNDFCFEVKDYKNCLMTLVTHLEEPTLLAEKTNGLFINQHVRIGCENDLFVRTFKICDGKDEWWFSDHEKRAAFIDQSY